MANEITVDMNMVATKNEVSIDPPQLSMQIDWTNPRFSSGTMSLTTTEGAIPLANVATPRWCQFKNVGTGTVLIGKLVSATFEKYITLAAGKGCVVPIDATPYAKMDSGTGTLAYHILDA